MNSRILLLLTLCAVVATTASAQADKFVKFPGGPKINFTVPMGYSFESKGNPDGSVTLLLDNPVWGIRIAVLIAVDRDAAVTTRAWQESKLIEHTAPFMSRAQETDYAIRTMTPLKGTGVYCVFSALGAESTADPVASGSPDSFTHVTGGVKAWPGTVVLFRIFSTGVKSAEYQEALDLFSWSFSD